MGMPLHFNFRYLGMGFVYSMYVDSVSLYFDPLSTDFIVARIREVEKYVNVFRGR